ncbi:MAG: helix-turn-helix domain-containing protein [Anaerolineae bacterium]|nr:helix-turn-helix domain-containing protein [Anaerolineae bacterium]
MRRSEYPDRDYDFGQQILVLRTAGNLTQSGLAERLGVSRQAVVGWEAGSSRPSPHHLKHFIEVCYQHNAFHSGQEAGEIRALWQRARVRVPLDETWLTRLLEKQPDASAATASLMPPPTAAAAAPESGTLTDWGDAPEVSAFYGREDELTLLTNWLLEDQCRVVSILGMGGIGKSALAVTLMHRVADQFDVVIWRSMRDAPPPESLRNEIVHLLAAEPLATTPATLEQQLNLLFEYLRRRRVLLVLDNLESVMDEAEGSGRMLRLFEGYGRLLRRAAETRHRSCILFTSREKPIDLAPLEGSRTPVRSLRLGQLDTDACESLLQETEVMGSPAERQRLVAHYGGNPLALKIVAPTIADLFGGEIGAFLEQGELIFGSVRYLLQEQFARLSAVEKSIMLWLAILREPVTVPQLANVLVRPLTGAQVLEALDTLRGRSLIARGQVKGSFTLQSVVLEYTTTCLIETAVSEIEHRRLQLLIDHALALANSKEYIGEAQVRLIVTPILARLHAAFPESSALEAHLLALLEPLRGQSDEVQGYAPANLLALLRTLRGDLSGLDLHQLPIRNADFRGIHLHDTNLAEATLHDPLFTEASDTIWVMAFSRNGTYWAGGDRQGQVQVWLYTKRRLQLTWRAHHSVVSAIAFSPDEQRLATGSWDGVFKMWNAADGALLWTSLAAGAVMGLAFSPDGRTLASGGTGGQIRLWDAVSGALLQTLHEHAGPVFCVCWSPHGEFLVSAGHDARIHFWQTAGSDSPRLMPTPAQTLDGHSGPVRGVAFSPDGQTLASGSWDGTVKLWEVARGAVRETIPVSSRLSGLAWSADGRYLALGELDRAFWVWDVEQHRQRKTFSGTMAPVRALAFSPDSSTLDTTHEDGSMQVWDMTTGQCIRRWQGFAHNVSDIAWSPGSGQIAGAGNNGLVTIWDVARQVPLHVLRGHKAIIWGVSWSPDGRWLASCSEDNTIRIWDAAKAVNVRILKDSALIDTQLFATVWSPDNKRLAVATHRQGVFVYDIHTLTFQRVGRADVPPRIRRVEWDPAGRYLVGAGEGGAIFIWNADDYSWHATLQGQRGMVVALAWSADGARLASGSWGHGSDQLFIWDTQNWNQVGAVDDPNELVFSVAWTADGERLISAGSDGALRWWNPQNGQCLLSRQGHEGPVQSLRASPDGRFLASCGDDGAIQIWRLDDGDHVTTLRRDRPYERLDITGIKGLTEAQKLTLKMMGAIERIDTDE